MYKEITWRKSTGGSSVLEDYSEIILQTRKMFANHEILPEFELLTYRAVQTSAGVRMNDLIVSLMHLSICRKKWGERSILLLCLAVGLTDFY